jgi:hypothetical protein
MAITCNVIATTGTEITPLEFTGSVAVTSVIVCNTVAYDNANPNAGLTYLTLHAVPTGGVVGADNMIVNQLPIPAGETVTFDNEKLVLGTGDKIVAYAVDAETLTATVSTLAV